MKKTSLGTKFLETFLDLREKDPSVFTLKVEAFLDKHDISYNRLMGDGLLTAFFGVGHVLHVNPNKRRQLVIIGKGVCYDSGGYDIKPTMKEMHMDRNGALLAIATSIDTGVEARVFFVNNMVHDGSGVVSGEILTEPVSGKKVFIDNTDAEGRIGLAHLLAHAQKDGFKGAITIATLTGAAVAVTGERTYALTHSNVTKDYKKLMDIALTVGGLWPAPFHADYDKAVISKIKGADITNCTAYRFAGSSTAFAFLKHFFKDHLVHVDMAAMDTDKDSNGFLWGIKEIESLIQLF